MTERLDILVAEPPEHAERDEWTELEERTQTRTLTIEARTGEPRQALESIRDTIEEYCNEHGHRPSGVVVDARRFGHLLVEFDTMSRLGEATSPSLHIRIEGVSVYPLGVGVGLCEPIGGEAHSTMLLQEVFGDG